MSYIGSTPTSQNFISGTDYFNGTGSQTVFTLARSVNSVNDVEVVVNNVIQQPNSYTVSGTTLTLSAAPSSGTSNVYVRYLATNQQSFTVGNNTIDYNKLTSDMQSKFAMKNRLINGAMVIDQRSAGASTTVTGIGYYSCDRWSNQSTVTSKYSVQQNAGSVTPPVGFANYLGMTSLSAYTVGASEVFSVRQLIEGYNIADLGWGTANAKTVTLSFWVRSSLTGTFGGSLRNSATDRSYPFSYTISAANTWEQKSITIAGDTTGTWLTTNGIGIILTFSIGSGSTSSGTAGSWAAGNYASATGATSVVGTNGATFYITGVQLEVGVTATTFDYRPYGTELNLCQRYYFQTQATGTNWNYLGAGVVYGATTVFTTVQYPVFMRTAPTISTFGTINTTNVQIVAGATVAGASAVASASSSEVNSFTTRIDFTTSGVTVGQGCVTRFAQNCGLTFSAEL